MTIFKQTTISLITAVLVSFFVYSGYTIYAADNVSYNFRNEKDYINAIDKYHREMNEHFNGKIRALRELTKDDDFLLNPVKRRVFEVPSDIDKKSDSLETILEKCRKDGINNISTYCVSMEALQIYMDYIQHLEGLKATLDDFPADSVTIKVNQMIEKNKIIEEEIDKSRSIMEGAVATYNEFSLAYPMHQKYRQIAKQLIKYKLTLKDIRKRVTFFPLEFIDVSTSQCK